MKRYITFLLMAVLGLVASQIAVADIVTLKNGTVYDGEIFNEGDTFLWVRVKIGTIENEHLVLRENITEIERVDMPAIDEAAGRKPGGEGREKLAIDDGAERIAFISLEEMVGTFMNADALLRSIDLLRELPENEQPTIVVLVINSGGGSLSEIQPLMEVITDEIRPYFRTVAWIKSAISAAAMTAWVIPEIYFYTKGNLGACTGFFGASGQQMDGIGLQQVLLQMEEASRLAGYDPAIMRSMQICGPDYPTTLSADIDEHGNVHWYLSSEKDAEPEGEYLVSKEDEILTFDSKQAKFFRFSKGTADTKNELAKVMGCAE